MERQLVSCILIGSLFTCIGCYSSRTVTKGELKGKVEQVDIAIYTKSFEEYKFSKENYRIRGDTLSGFGVQVGKERMTMSDYSKQTKNRPASTPISENATLQDSVVVSIAFADITRLVVSEFNLSNTVIAIVLTVGLPLGFLLILVETHNI